MHDVENVLGDSAFWTAFVVAVAGTALVWLRIRRREAEPGVAFVVVVAIFAGIRVEHRLTWSLVVAVLLLTVGEHLTRGESSIARVLALVPGALVLGAAVPDGWPFWMRVVVAGTTVFGGVLAVDADRRAPRLLPALLAIGAVGLYVCVPDTEAPKVLMGALMGAAALGLEPLLRHRCGFAAVTGLFAWVVAIGGLGRAGSVVGGIACLGVVLLLPLVPRWSLTTRSAVVALVVQVALVLFVSRVAGFEESAWTALLLTIPAFVVAWVVLALLRRPAQ